MIDLHRFVGNTVKLMINTSNGLDTLDGTLKFSDELRSFYMDFETDFSDYRIFINPEYVVTLRVNK